MSILNTNPSQVEIEKVVQALKNLNESPIDYLVFEFESDQLLNYLALRIEETKNINITNDVGATALIILAASGLSILDYVGLMTLLINAGADLNIQDRNGYSALMWACEMQDPEVVKLLIDAGADIFLTSGDKTALVVLAHYIGNTEIATMLLQAAFQQDREKNQRKIVVRVDDGPCESVYVIFDNKIRVNMALLYTLRERLRYDPIAIMKLLINDTGFNKKNSKDGGIGDIVFNHALVKGYKEIVTMLISLGVDVNSAGCYYFTPLIFAIQNNQTDTLKMLLASGADVTKGVSWYRTPLFMALCKKNKTNIKLILEAHSLMKKRACIDTLLLWYVKIFRN